VKIRENSLVSGPFITYSVTFMGCFAVGLIVFDGFKHQGCQENSSRNGRFAMHSQPCRAIIRVSYISTVKFVIQVYVGEVITDN
jgi:hypothetical protein